MFSMKTPILSAILFAGAFLLGAVSDPDIVRQRGSFADPPDDCRIMMRWWWFGPAVNKTELEREMKLMKEGGIGGFEVQPVYPLALDDPDAGIQNFPFLSDNYYKLVYFHLFCDSWSRTGTVIYLFCASDSTSDN